MQKALKKPEAFSKQLTADAASPAAKKFLFAKLRPRVEPGLKVQELP